MIRLISAIERSLVACGADVKLGTGVGVYMREVQ